MKEHRIDISQIHLQENIPLTEEEIRQFETTQKTALKIAVITITIAIPLLGAIAALSAKKETLYNLKYYDYVLFAGVGLFLFAFFYFMAWLADKFSKHNWQKDKLNGKSKLTSVVVNRHKTEDGQYLTFAGPSENKKIRIEVEQADYNRYKIGSKVTVTYLKYSRKSLEIVGH
jgi:hypothetical protein